MRVSVGVIASDVRKIIVNEPTLTHILVVVLVAVEFKFSVALHPYTPSGTGSPGWPPRLSQLRICYLLNIKLLSHVLHRFQGLAHQLNVHVATP